MGKVLITESILQDTADAIREKAGTVDTMKPSEFAENIENIPSSGLDWSALGYSGTPDGITEIYNYAVGIKENWKNVSDLTEKFKYDDKLAIMPLVDTSNATTMYSMFSNCRGLHEVPLLNMENVTNTEYMFQNCSALTTIPLLNTSNSTSMRAMFSGCANLTTIPVLDTSSLTGTNVFSVTFQNCNNLTDTSLDNILQMCINATSYRATKTLARLGFNSTNYPVSRIEALPHYQDFTTAGWTIGY